MHKTGLLFLIFSLTLLFSSCDKVTIKYPIEKKTLRIGILTFPKTLNPAYLTDETSTIIANKVFDSLYYFDDNGSSKSRIIKNEKIILKENVLEIDLILRKDIFFSDGKNLTADDVIETFYLLKNKSYLSSFRSYLNTIKRIEKSGEFELRVIFEKKNANWRNYLTFKILNSYEIYEICPEIFKSQLLVGSGSLKFDKIRRPSKIILSLNPYYKKNHLEESLYYKIIYSVILYPHNSPLKIMNDEIDIVDLPPESVSVYKSNPKWRHSFNILEYKKFGYTYLAFNLNIPKLSLNIRKIIYNSLYNSDFLKRFILNKGEIIKSPFLLLNKEIKTTRLDTKVLKNEISITVLTNTKSRIKKEFILFLSTELKAYNIKLVPIFLEQQLMLDRIKKKEFEIAISGFVLDIDYDMKDILYSKGYFNYAGYNSKKMDKLLDMGLEEFDKKERKRVYIKAHNLWAEDLPLIPLYNLYFYMGISKNIKIPKKTISLMSSSGDFLQNIDEWLYGPFLDLKNFVLFYM